MPAFSRVPGKNQFLVSPTFWLLLTFLDLWLHHSNTYFHGHIAFSSSLCSQIPFCFPLISILYLLLLVGPIWLNQNNLSPSQNVNLIIEGHIYRFQRLGPVIFGVYSVYCTVFYVPDLGLLFLMESQVLTILESWLSLSPPLTELLFINLTYP